jgi:peroxiredoxin family protein
MNEEYSEIAQTAIFKAINNQIRDGDPPLVKETLSRLISEGQSREDAMKLIGCALSVELFGIMQSSEAFDSERYNNNLSKLPELPWDE